MTKNKQKKLYSSGEENINFFYYLWILLRLKTKQLLRGRSSNKNKKLHKSFRLTRRRDAVRPLKLPGYWRFTKDVWMVIKNNKTLFMWLVVLMAIGGVVTIGLLSQDFLDTLTDTLEETGSSLFKGGFGEIGKTGLLLVSVFSTGGLANNITEAQQILLFFGLLFVWLVVVWSLRNALAGNKVKLRDALYNCGAPIISTFIVLALILVQLVPVMLSVIAYSAAVSTNFLSGGVEAMVFASIVFLLSSLSLYWVIGSFLAMVIVAIPGVRPLQALRIANNMVAGRRLQILFRLLWCFSISAVSIFLVVLPVYLLANLLNSSLEFVSSVPIVPFVLYVAMCCAVIFGFSYVYMLYRGIIESDAKK